MNPSYFVAWFTSKVLCETVFRRRVCNPERVPAEGAVILAANHASYMDPPLVGSSLPRDLHYLARESLFKYPGVRQWLHSMNAVPVDRDGGGAKGLKAILDRLLAGGGIILFPEGTRTHDGTFQRGRSGVGLAVIKSTAPVVPVRVFGTYEAWGRHVRIPKPHPVVVKFGEPMYFEKERGEARVCSKPRLKAIYQEVADTLMARIADLQPFEEKRTFP
jgi:1-acyl-sn-glycerol-3-phosphate acyltransferase